MSLLLLHLPSRPMTDMRPWDKAEGTALSAREVSEQGWTAGLRPSSPQLLGAGEPRGDEQTSGQKTWSRVPHLALKDPPSPPRASEGAERRQIHTATGQAG